MKKFLIEIKWGVIFFIAGLVWTLFEKFMGWHDEAIGKEALYGTLFAVIAVGIYILALLDKKRNFYNGTMTWGQGFVAGAIITIIIAFLSPFAQYISYRIISPEYFHNITEYTLQNTAMTQKGAAAYYNLKSFMLQSVFTALAMGIVTSAIVAYFVKSKEVRTNI